MVGLDVHCCVSASSMLCRQTKGLFPMPNHHISVNKRAHQECAEPNLATLAQKVRDGKSFNCTAVVCQWLCEINLDAKLIWSMLEVS